MAARDSRGRCFEVTWALEVALRAQLRWHWVLEYAARVPLRSHRVLEVTEEVSE